MLVRCGCDAQVSATEACAWRKLYVRLLGHGDEDNVGVEQHALSAKPLPFTRRELCEYFCRLFMPHLAEQQSASVTHCIALTPRKTPEDQLWHHPVTPARNLRTLAVVLHALSAAV